MMLFSNFSDQLQDAQNALTIVQRDLDTMANEEVPALIRDSASLQVTKIIRGDYDLKIARQDYFTSKQDQVPVLNIRCPRLLYFESLSFNICDWNTKGYSI